MSYHERSWNDRGVVVVVVVVVVVPLNWMSQTQPRTSSIALLSLVEPERGIVTWVLVGLPSYNDAPPTSH